MVDATSQHTTASGANTRDETVETKDVKGRRYSLQQTASFKPFDTLASAFFFFLFGFPLFLGL